MMEEEDDHIILEEKIIIEEEEVMEEIEAEPEKIVKFRASAEDDVLEMGAGDEGLEDLREGLDNLREVIEEGSVEDGEIEEEKRKSKTLRVHLPDLLQGIDNDDDEAFTTSENIERLAKRAARFNIENDLSNEDANKVLKSLNIPYEEREIRAQGRYRLDHIELYGVFGMSFDDLQEYFDDHLDDFWTPNDDYGIVKFRQDINAFRAILKMSKPIGEPKKEERIIKHVLTADDASPERKVITKETKDEFDKMVHPDDIPIEMPEGKWRYGKHHKKCGAILMRFPLKTALKTKKGHYLQYDRSDRTRNVQPQDLKDIEQQERDKRNNFDPKNPWMDLSQEWSRNRETGEREYVMPLSALDRPNIRLSTGLRDWDAPRDPDHPVQIRPRESRKRKYSEEEAKTFFESTQEISDDNGENEDESESEEEAWQKKLKKPRLGMVADIEEAKQKKASVKDRLQGGGGRPAKRMRTSEGPRLKRQISNNYVVSEKIIVESSDDDDFNDPALIEEAQNDDLRHQLTMRVENRPTGRPILKATKRLTNRFAEADSEDEDKDFAFENMRIEIRGDENSDDERMDVEEPQDARAKLKQRREAKENIDHKKHQTDLRDRMSRDRKSTDVGPSRDRKRTDSGQSRDRKRTDSGQSRDRKSADAGSSRDRKRERRHEMEVDSVLSRDKVRSPVAVDDLRKRMSSKSSKSVKVKDEFEEDKRKEKNKKDKSKGTLDDEREGVQDQIRELKDVKAQEKQLLDKLNEKLKRMEQDKEELRRKSIKSAEAKERAARDKTRREPREQATDRRRRKSTERRRSVEDRTSRKSDASASKRRKRSPSSSSDSDDYSSSSSESDESSSDNDSASSSSDSSSDSSSSEESSSSSSDSESSSGEESSPDRKKKHKSSSSRNKKDAKTSSSKRKPASSASNGKKSSKSDDKKSAKPQQSRTEDKKSSSSSNKKSDSSSAKQSEDKKKDADLKAKLENFVNKSKTKKDKK